MNTVSTNCRIVEDEWQSLWARGWTGWGRDLIQSRMNAVKHGNWQGGRQEELIQISKVGCRVGSRSGHDRRWTQEKNNPKKQKKKLSKSWNLRNWQHGVSDLAASWGWSQYLKQWRLDEMMAHSWAEPNTCTPDPTPAAKHKPRSCVWNHPLPIPHSTI